MGRRYRQRARMVRMLEAATTKTEGGDSFPAGAYAYVPDAAKPSTWKLRLWEAPDDGPTAKQVGMALAALSPGGFRGNKVQVPASDLPAVKRKIMAAWKKVHPGDDDTPSQLKEALAGNRTMDEVRTLVQSALQDQVDGYPWLSDLSDDWLAYEVNGTHFHAPYMLDDDGTVAIGEPTEVERRTQYVPVADDNGQSDAAVAVPSTESEEPDRIHGRVVEAKGTDEAGGRVYDVQIVDYGDSRNGKRYPQAVMQEAVGLYEGAKAFDHHRSLDELASSTITGLVGSYRNVRATSTGLTGELHLLPSATHAAEALDASLAAQAQGLAPVVGISHDVMAKYLPLVDAGRRLLEAKQIVKVNSADVVADPAAGGRATRMVAGGTGAESQEDIDMNLKDLLAALRATPDKRAELLAEHKATLDEYGLDEGAIGRLLDPAAPAPAVTPPAVPAAVDPPVDPALAAAGVQQATESYAKASVVGTMLVRAAVGGVGLDERFVESISKRLPERFTEAQLTEAVAAYGEMRRELEADALVRVGGRAPHVSVTKEEHDKKIAALDAFFEGRTMEGQGYKTLKQAFCDITGTNPVALSPAELSQMVMRESIGTELYDSAAIRGLESAQSGTWNLILGDSITRRMVAMYQQPNLQTWRAIVSSVVPIVDFRTQRIERLGGYGVLPAVNQGGPYQPLTTPGNEEATYSISKRGGTEDLTLETIANDDIRAVQRIPTLLGLAAAQTLYRFVWDNFITNPTYTPDSTSLFGSGHTNTASTALSNGNLSAARAAMRQQTAYGDTKDILSIIPKFLVVNSQLEALAFELTESAVALPTSAPDGGASNIPNLHQGMTAIVVDYWTATSSTAWFIVADPNLIPTVELGFYNGREDPELFVQNDPTVGSVFTADKLTYKIRHIYGGAVLDFRGLYRGNS